MVPLRLPERLLDEFFDEIQAMVSCVCGETGIDHSGKLGRIAVWAQPNFKARIDALDLDVEGPAL